MTTLVVFPSFCQPVSRLSPLAFRGRRFACYHSAKRPWRFRAQEASEAALELQPQNGLGVTNGGDPESGGAAVGLLLILWYHNCQMAIAEF